MKDIQQPRKHGNGFSFSHCNRDSSMLEEYLLSLLTQPLPSTDFLVPSFEDPFEDLKMEPLPFRKEVSTVFQIKQQIPDLDIQSHDQSEPNLGQNATFIEDPIDVVGSKRESHNASSSHPDYDGSSTSSDQQSHPHVTESIARFRPCQDKKWNGSFQRLIKFKNEFGHCCVPHSYAEDPALARWVKRQRHQYKKFKDNDPSSTLTTSRLEQLESVGFVWQSHAAAWLEKLN
mmetsp:Transcript_5884/g.13954  ORF Transcript_5884/g.13954 Transcript_5884/m.13954 type:complete len:231 (-) Transcript_5884:20-712(-)